MRRAAAGLLLVVAAIGGTVRVAGAQSISPGARVPAIIGLNWDAHRPAVRTGDTMRVALTPLVTATVTAELSLSDLDRRRAAATAPSFRVQLAGGRPGPLEIPVPVMLARFQGGGVTGHPVPLIVTYPRSATDVHVLVSLTGGP